ncbi:hypothetical protein HHX47_DHR1002051, partial [Lentinula edodes]
KSSSSAVTIDHSKDYPEATISGVILYILKKRIYMRTIIHEILNEQRTVSGNRHLAQSNTSYIWSVLHSQRQILIDGVFFPSVLNIDATPTNYWKPRNKTCIEPPMSNERGKELHLLLRQTYVAQIIASTVCSIPSLSMNPFGVIL